MLRLPSEHHPHPRPRPCPTPLGTEATAGNLKPHDVILGEHGLPAVSEKVYKTQSQHHTITGVNCIYNPPAVVD